MKIVEPDARLGQRINGCGLMLRTVAAKVTETNIVKNRDYDIGLSNSLTRPPRL